MNDCIFCKIINREVDASIVKEDEHTIVFMSLDNHPLVIPKKHIKDIYELDKETGCHVMNQLTETAKLVKEKLHCDGVYIDQRNEKAAGQEVFHIHFHVYPRWEKENKNQFNSGGDAERELIFNTLKQ